VGLQFKTECADREKIEAKLFESKQNSALAARLGEKLTPNAVTILNQLQDRGKKSETDLLELETILESLES
jgi:hypothetical protein